MSFKERRSVGISGFFYSYAIELERKFVIIQTHAGFIQQNTLSLSLSLCLSLSLPQVINN